MESELLCYHIIVWLWRTTLLHWSCQSAIDDLPYQHLSTLLIQFCSLNPFMLSQATQFSVFPIHGDKCSVFSIIALIWVYFQMGDTRNKMGWTSSHRCRWMAWKCYQRYYCRCYKWLHNWWVSAYSINWCRRIRW
jgi:hypothetical protein